MPRLPSPSNAWRFRVNLATTEGTDLEHRARLLFEIKQSMLGVGTFRDSNGAAATVTTPWTVVASSDSVSAVGVDRWSDISDLVWEINGVAHSWIVLQHPNLFAPGVPGQVLFDCSQSGAAERNAALGVYFSRAGFNVGAPSVTDRPTAADEVVVLAADGEAGTSGWQGPATNDAEHLGARLHFMISDDGRSVRWFIYRSTIAEPDACVGLGDLFPVPDYDIATEWDMPALMRVWSLGTDVECCTWALHRSDTGTRYKGRDGLAVGAFEAWASAPVITTSDTASPALAAVAFNGAVGLAPIQLAGAAPAAGLFAAVPDLWWGSEATRTEQFPGDGSMQFSQIGDVLTQWNRTTLRTS